MHEVIAWFYIIISCILQLLHGFTSAFVAHICSCHVTLLCALSAYKPYNSSFCFFVHMHLIYACNIHSLLHVYAGQSVLGTLRLRKPWIYTFYGATIRGLIAQSLDPPTKCAECGYRTIHGLDTTER